MRNPVPLYVPLIYAITACVANAMQVPNVWDIWDVACLIMVGTCILSLFYVFGDDYA